MSSAAFVVGEALVDIVVDGDSTVEHPGGSPMNVAYGLARLGVATTFRASVGRDARGDALLAHLASAGVSVDPATVASHRTSTAVATIQEDRHAEYEFDIEWAPGAISVPDGVALLHTGSIATALAPGSDDVRRLFEASRDRALLSFDPNVRPSITPDRDAVQAAVDALARVVHVLKMSDEDAAWLHPGMPLDAVLDRYLGLGVALAAITRGPDGAVAATSADRVALPSLPVEVVDTIGAGDAFMSGLLYALLDGGHADAVRRGGLAAGALSSGALSSGALSSGTLSSVVATALASARVTVSRAGANPPTVAELRR